MGTGVGGDCHPPSLSITSRRQHKREALAFVESAGHRVEVAAVDTQTAAMRTGGDAREEARIRRRQSVDLRTLDHEGAIADRHGHGLAFAQLPAGITQTYL